MAWASQLGLVSTKPHTYCCASRGLPWGSASSSDSGRCEAAGPGAGAGASSGAAPDAVIWAVDIEIGCGLETGRMSAACAGRQLQLAAAPAKHSSQSQMDPWLQAELQFSQADWPPKMLPRSRTQPMSVLIPSMTLGPRGVSQRTTGSVTVWKPEVSCASWQHMRMALHRTDDGSAEASFVESYVSPRVHHGLQRWARRQCHPVLPPHPMPLAPHQPHPAAEPADEACSNMQNLCHARNRHETMHT